MPEVKTDLQQSINNLSKILDDLPMSPETRKTIFDIAKITRLENINSNIIAFYLNGEEEHGLQNIFFESLCELIREKEIRIELDNNFEVIREFKNIDILIASRSLNPAHKIDVFNWAIIIEHKINHKLDNDLKDYWERVEVIEDGTKIGVVLSPWGQKDKSLLRVEEELEEGTTRLITEYLDLNHRDWMRNVKARLPKVDSKIDNYHLSFLKDFLNNIESMYTNKEQQKMNDNQLNIFHKNVKPINEILQLNKKVREHVFNESINVMAGFDFASDTPYFSEKHKLFFADKENNNKPKYFRFYIWYPALVENGELNLHFDLNKEYKQYGEALHTIKRKELQKIIEPFQASHPNIYKGSSHDYFQILHIKDQSFKDFKDGKMLASHFSKRMEKLFFDKKNGMIWKFAKLVEDVIEMEKEKPKADV